MTTPEHLFLRLPPVFLGHVTPFEDIDLTLHTPGDVLVASAGADVSGSTALWRDPGRVQEEGFAVTTRTTTAPPGWLVPGLAGLGWGAALALGWRWLRPHAPAAHEAPAPPLPPEAAPESDPPLPPSSPRRPGDPSVWAGDGVSAVGWRGAPLPPSSPCWR